MAALWIDPAHDIADGAVLAAGVHPLQHQQEAMLVAGIKPILQVIELELEFGQSFLRLGLVGAARAVIRVLPPQFPVAFVAIDAIPVKRTHEKPPREELQIAN